MLKFGVDQGEFFVLVSNRGTDCCNKYKNQISSCMLITSQHLCGDGLGSYVIYEICVTYTLLKWHLSVLYMSVGLRRSKTAFTADFDDNLHK